MKGIGGNTKAEIQICTTAKNDIGESVKAWETVQLLNGWLDLSSGDSKYTYDTKLQESTHIFICDYVAIDRKTDNKRLMVNGLAYEILLIDDPMELHQQIEIILKYVG